MTLTKSDAAGVEVEVKFFKFCSNDTFHPSLTSELNNIKMLTFYPTDGCINWYNCYSFFR